MTTPDSPIAASIELDVLSRAIKRSRETAIVLNAGSVLLLVAWIVAHFFYPLPILGWLAAAFFGLAHIHQVGRSLIDHHAAMNTLIPLELQIVQTRAAQEVMQRVVAQNEALQSSLTTDPDSASGVKIVPASAIGLTGRKVN